MKNSKNKLTLAIDIGGSGIKMLVLDSSGEPVTEKTRLPTPRPAKPKSMLNTIQKQLPKHGTFDRISVGFPGVVMDGMITTAANLHDDWIGFNLQTQLQEITSLPVRVANDADIQGYGVIKGQGVELVLTLGTGFGSALFHHGVLIPNLELGHHPFRDDQTYEDLLRQTARKSIGNERWSIRVLQAIQQLEALFNPNMIYLGGGNAKKITVDLPDNVVITSNIAGILGGIMLWSESD